MVRGGHDLAHSVLEELQSAVGRTGHFYDRNAIRFDAVQLDDLGAGQEESGRRRDDAAHGHHQQRRQLQRAHVVGGTLRWALVIRARS